MRESTPVTGTTTGRNRTLDDAYSNEDRLVGALLASPIPGKKILEVGAARARLDPAGADGADVTVIDYVAQPGRGGRTRTGRGHHHPGARDALSMRSTRAPSTSSSTGLMEHFATNSRFSARTSASSSRVPGDDRRSQAIHIYTVMKKTLIALNRWFAGWRRSTPSTSSRRSCDGRFEIAGRYGDWMCPASSTGPPAAPWPAPASRSSRSTEDLPFAQLNDACAPPGAGAHSLYTYA